MTCSFLLEMASTPSCSCIQFHSHHQGPPALIQNGGWLFYDLTQRQHLKRGGTLVLNQRHTQKIARIAASPRIIYTIIYSACNAGYCS